MCSSNFGLNDILFKEDLYSKDDEDSLRNMIFASNDHSLQTPGIKQENLDLDFKVLNDSVADELWRTYLENDVTLEEDDLSSYQGKDYDDLPLAGLPFDAVVNGGDRDHIENASDSGVSTDVDHLLSSDFGSPDRQGGRLLASPSESDFASPDTLDVESDASSSISDPGSLQSSPSVPGGRIPPYQFELISGLHSDSKDIKSPTSTAPESHLTTTTTTTTPQFIKIANSELATQTQPAKVDLTTSSVKRPPQVTKLRLDLSGGVTSLTGASSAPCAPSATTVTPGGLTTGAKTIVVTHPGKSGATPSLLRNGGTLLKTASVNGKSILMPVNVKDINQFKTIRIISAGANGSNLSGKTSARNLVSTIQSSNSSTQSGTGHQNGGLRTLFTTTKMADGRSLFKVTPTALVTPNTVSSSSGSSITIKEECITSDDEGHQNGQELVLSDEEKRLLKKESIMLPSHYPLTKQEERDLKRIRRKIRNKISAQDSRKRKKEYVDGLEDRVKNCTEENHQLQKRIKHLETQNETLLVQLKKFHNILGGAGVHSRNQGHSSTALMMLILSAALFVVPSLRQQGNADNEVSRSSDLPSAGRSRSLLEAKIPLGMNPLDPVEGDEGSDSDSSDHLSDHDYAPQSKKQRLMSASYYPDLINEMPPRLDKTLPDGSGKPPDGIGGLKDISALLGAFLERLSTNWTDPGGKDIFSRTRQQAEKPPRNRSLVVNLSPKGKFRDDIELE